MTRPPRADSTWRSTTRPPREDEVTITPTGWYDVRVDAGLDDAAWDRLEQVGLVVVLHALVGDGVELHPRRHGAQHAEQRQLLGQKVFLELWVKVIPGWTGDPNEARRLTTEVEQS